ncbi:hypothetical protein LAWASA_1543 [Lawsonibacter asaccharolyticus]|nr:hypothetical protein LAWASA_1543 [Lawsonibacter asaccharolyticus]
MPNRGELVILDRYIAETGKRGTALARIQTQRGGKRRKRSPLFRIGMVLYGILVALSAVIVGVYAVWNLTVRPPEIPQEPDPAPPAGSGSQAAEPVEQEQPAGRQRREDVYNFVLLGRDRESANTDTIIVVSYDVANQKVGMISIPRDTAVNRDWRKDPKINGAYAGAGVDVLKEEIEQTFGIPIDYYIYVDLKGFVALVDELEGVDVYIPEEMNYDDPYQDLHIHYTKGQHHLNGQQAMEVVRFRHNNDGSGYTDVGRAEMQRQVLVALAKKVVSWNSLTKVQEFVEIFQEYVKTDLSTTDMLYFASQAVGVDLDTGITQGTLEGRGEGVVRGYKYCFVFQAEDILPTLNELVNPYDQPLTEEDLDLPQAEYYWNGTVID